MLRYLHSNQLDAYPVLRDSMFRDRATQFHDRLGWDVTVDARGQERDAYDDLDPLYVIWEGEGGRHGGSMRFLPTTGRTMVNEHFLHLTDGVAIQSPFIWECTRFCLAPTAESRVAAALMLAGGELMRAFHLSHFVGVFDARNDGRAFIGRFLRRIRQVLLLHTCILLIASGLDLLSKLCNFGRKLISLTAKRLDLRIAGRDLCVGRIESFFCCNLIGHRFRSAVAKRAQGRIFARKVVIALVPSLNRKPAKLTCFAVRLTRPWRFFHGRRVGVLQNAFELFEFGGFFSWTASDQKENSD